MQTPSQILVDVRGANYSANGQTILHNISLSISRREIITIIGPNGSGKSSLIKLVAKLEKPNSGAVQHHGKLRIGYVPQRLFLDKSMPLSVSRFMRLSSSGKKESLEALTRVQAKPLWEKQMHDLSGGEFQRVLLARAIVRKPDLLLLDEPLQGVDVSGQATLYQLIADIRDTLNCGIVMVSHDLHLVMAQTDQVLCLNHHICCQGTPENVSNHPEYLSLFGPRSAENIAVYTHHHDHHHDLSGEVEHCNDSCQHD